VFLSIPAIYSRAKVRTLACLPLICLAGAIALAGCGGSDEGPLVEPASDIEQPSDLLVTKSDIEEADPDSPYGRLLAWWQALQFDNFPVAQTFFANNARPANFETVAREVKGLGTARPILVETNESGNRITLLTVVRFASPARTGEGKSSVLVKDAPATFRLVRQGGVWKLADNRYLTERLRSERELEAQNQQNQTQPG
jgi:hypothetical protein